MYAIKIYKDENRLIGPFKSESDAQAYREHILHAPSAEIVLMLEPVDECLSIAKQKALKAYRQPPRMDDN